MKTSALILTFASLVFFAVTGNAQTIWQEDFNDPTLDGKGGFGTTTLANQTDMTGVTNWTIDISAADLADEEDFWKVDTQQFIGQDLDGEAVWSSKSVDIASYGAVSFSLDITGTGGLEDDDYLTVGYILDGGSEVAVVSNINDFTTYNYQYNGLSGTGMTLVVRANNGAGSEQHYFDNVLITLAPSNEPPVFEAVGDKFTFENISVNFDVIAREEVDGDVISLWATDVPSGATFTGNTNAMGVTNAFSWPSPTPVGVYTTTFWAADTDGTVSTTIVITVDAVPGDADVMINEICVNPDGGDDNREFLEVRGASNAPLTGMALLQIEGDDSEGVIDSVQDLSALNLGANGLLILGDNYTNTSPWIIPPQTTVANMSGSLENSTVTFLLVTNFTGTSGDDLDTDNNGTLDVTPWDAILDAVGWSDGGGNDSVYTLAVLTQSSGTPDAATRFPSNLSARSAAAWYNGDLTNDVGYSMTQASSNMPAGAYLTPGGDNFPVYHQPPVLSPIGDQSTEESNTLAFAVTASDPADGDIITLWATDLPAGAVFPTVTNTAVATNTFNWTEPTPVGVYTTTFWAADADGTNTETVTITVTEPLGVTLFVSEMCDPAADYAANRYIEIYNPRDVAVDLTGWEVRDYQNGAEGSGDTHSWILSGTIASGEAMVCGDTNNAQADFDIDWSNNSWNGGADDGAMLYYNSNLVDQAYGLDFADDSLIRTQTVCQPATVFAAGEWYAESAPAIGEGGSTPGTHVCDCPGTPTTNRPPELAAIGNQSTEESNTLSFAVTATDPTDGDLITLWATDLPAGATFATVSNTASVSNNFNWVTPTPDGVYTSTFWAADKDGTNSETILITVTPVIEANLLISELCDPLDGYASNRYIEIYNPQDVAVDLAGWELRDYVNGAEGSGDTHVWTLSGTIASGEALVCGETGNNQADFTIAWANTSWNGGADDGAMLYYNSNLVDQAYGLEFADDSMIRTQTVCIAVAVVDSNEWYVESAPAIGEGGSTPGTHVCDCPAGGEDTDHDGLPDAWELQYFGSATSTNTAEGDYDEDGTDNLFEYIADTNPTNAASLFEALITNDVTAVGATMDLQVGPPTSDERYYDVFWTTNIVVEPIDWTPFNLDVVGSSAGAALWLTVTNEGAGRFYRTGVKVP